MDLSVLNHINQGRLLSQHHHSIWGCLGCDYVARQRSFDQQNITCVQSAGGGIGSVKQQSGVVAAHAAERSLPFFLLYDANVRTISNVSVTRALGYWRFTGTALFGSACAFILAR